MTYPTAEHAQAAEAIVTFFAESGDAETVLLTGSCARGTASADSDLDLVVLAHPEVLATRGSALDTAWRSLLETDAVFRALREVGAYALVNLEVIDGRFTPQPRSWTSGPDAFELEIGNTYVYSSVLWRRGDYLEHRKADYLPYYDEALRRERLATVRRYCTNNLNHIPLYLRRGLYFQSFDRLYKAFQEFLQGLFIARRTYPIAYDKWIREQVAEVLGESDLYARLPRLFEIRRLESDELALKAEELRAIVEEYVA